MFVCLFYFFFLLQKLKYCKWSLKCVYWDELKYSLALFQMSAVYFLLDTENRLHLNRTLNPK